MTDPYRRPEKSVDRNPALTELVARGADSLEAKLAREQTRSSQEKTNGISRRARAIGNSLRPGRWWFARYAARLIVLIPVVVAIVLDFRQGWPVFDTLMAAAAVLLPYAAFTEWMLVPWLRGYLGPKATSAEAEAESAWARTLPWEMSGYDEMLERGVNVAFAKITWRDQSPPQATFAAAVAGARIRHVLVRDTERLAFVFDEQSVVALVHHIVSLLEVLDRSYPIETVELSASDTTPAETASG